MKLKQTQQQSSCLLKEELRNHLHQSIALDAALTYQNTLLDKIKRKFRTLLCKMPVFKVHFGQNFL